MPPRKRYYSGGWTDVMANGTVDAAPDLQPHENSASPTNKFNKEVAVPEANHDSDASLDEATPTTAATKQTNETNEPNGTSVPVEQPSTEYFQPSHHGSPKGEQFPRLSPQGFSGQTVNTARYEPPPPPQRNVNSEPLETVQEGVTSPIPYERDLQKLIGYLIPCPRPQLPDGVPSMPQRFVIYTPPHPPFLDKPVGESRTDSWRKEGIPHFCRRKWTEELREAKMRTPKDGKTTRWKRLKWRATKGTDWGIDKTKTSNLEFLNRVARMQDLSNEKAPDVYHKAVSPEEIVLVYPPKLLPNEDQGGSGGQELKEEFMGSLNRTKKTAFRNSIIAALLFPPAIVVDTFAVPVWPFGGLAEIDAVWLYASVRGAKTSHSITKRLSIPPDTIEYASADPAAEKKRNLELRLTFMPSQQLHTLEKYLAARCHEKNPQLFPEYVAPPSESQVMDAIGWSHVDPVERGKPLDWEDRQWELRQMRDDVERCFVKGAEEWVGEAKKWVKKDKKAVKKAEKKAAKEAKKGEDGKEKAE
ncbi:Hypothetical predicted protein [Lecanosticta acicola]|uniref:Secreted protein n=1 Tax=Lecanosticta acicola TaxID=111012 RepID=A0AAI8Z782_9PEZI|nr:Hypothetical predicted protein [Lecanosticta acicola]